MTSMQRADTDDVDINLSANLHSVTAADFPPTTTGQLSLPSPGVSKQLRSLDVGLWLAYFPLLVPDQYRTGV